MKKQSKAGRKPTVENGEPHTIKLSRPAWKEGQKRAKAKKTTVSAVINDLLTG